MSRVIKYKKYFFLLLFLGFGLVAFAANRYPLNPFDLHVSAFVQSFETPALTKVAKFFTTIGSVKFSIIITVSLMLFLYFILRHRMELVFLCGVVGGSAVLNMILKMVFHRERPTIHRLIEETGFSFPSGHSMGAIALYGALAFLLWRHIHTRSARLLLIVLSCFMIVLICTSRIYLGVHYPSDIIAALAVGGLWLGFMIWAYQLYMERRN